MVNVLFADGFEEIEALTVVDLLRRAKIDVKIVSADNKSVISGGHGIKVTADAFLCEAEVSDMVVLPGGIPGVPNLLNNENVIDYIKKHYEQSKYISAICAAPSILSKIGILKDKNATSYPSYESELDCKKYTNESVTVDGNIITSKAAGTAIDFALEIVKILTDISTAESVKKSIYYR